MDSLDSGNKNGYAADFVTGASTLLKTVSAITEGNATAKAYNSVAKGATTEGDFEAAQLVQSAGQSKAEAQRKAIEERRAGRLAISKANAVAAASGAGPTSDITASLAEQTKYNELAQLFMGDEEARNKMLQAEGVKYNAKANAAGYKSTGKAYSNYGYQKAAGTLLEGGATFLEKYGDETTDENDTVSLDHYGTKHPGPYSTYR